MNIQGTSVFNPAGGQDLFVAATKQFGPDKTNITAGPFAGGNTQAGPPYLGALASANANGHSFSVARTIVPEVSATNTHGVNANLFKNDQHTINANAFSSATKLNNGFAFQQNRAGLNYESAAGHAASVGVTKIPGFGNLLDVAAKANIIKTPSTSVDVMANSTSHLSGPFQGKTDYGVAAGFTYNFK